MRWKRRGVHLPPFIKLRASAFRPFRAEPASANHTGPDATSGDILAYVYMGTTDMAPAENRPDAQGTDTL